MSREWKGDGGIAEEFGPDAELGSVLGLLDPASIDPNYWLRFRGWVLTNAAGELTRRRLMGDLSVAEVLASWARTVVPTALLAAAIGGLLLAGDEPSPLPGLTVEEMLVAGIEGEAILVALGLVEGTTVTFASGEGF